MRIYTEVNWRWTEAGLEEEVSSSTDYCGDLSLCGGDSNGGGGNANRYDAIALKRIQMSSGAASIGTTISGDMIRITAAGTYMVMAKAMANAVLLNRIRLWNNTNDTMLVMGLSCLARSAHDSNSLATLDGQFVTTGAIDVELHHWVSATNEGDGKGVATSSNQGDTEVYAQVELWKVA